MNPISKRLAWPVFGLLLMAALVAQARGFSVGPEAAAAPALSPAANIASDAAQIRAEGRVVAYPGAQAVLGAEMSGRLTLLEAHEGASVKRGEVLAEIEHSELDAALRAARARVHEQESDLAWLDGELTRADHLQRIGAASTQVHDRAQHERQSAEARLALSRAEVEQVRATLSKAQVRAPFDAVIVTRHAEPAEMISVGQPLYTLADLSRVRIEAEIDEFDAGKVALGDSARVSAEGYLGQTFAAHVEEIPRAVASRRLKPRDPGRPEDTRVLLVKLGLGEATPLLLGQRVELSLSHRSR